MYLVNWHRNSVNRLPDNLLKRNIDPRLMMTMIIIGIMVLFILSLPIFVTTTPQAEENFWREFPKLPLALAVLILPWYLYDRGYQVGWDDEGVYFRLFGFRFEAAFRSAARLERDSGRSPGLLGWFTYHAVSFMRYEDMVSLDGKSDKRLGGTARYRPSAALYISGTANPPGLYDNLIGIDFDSFKRESILDFMEVLYGKRPELVPKGWVKQIEKRAELG